MLKLYYIDMIGDCKRFAQSSWHKDRNIATHIMRSNGTIERVADYWYLPNELIKDKVELITDYECNFNLQR